MWNFLIQDLASYEFRCGWNCYQKSNSHLRSQHSWNKTTRRKKKCLLWHNNNPRCLLLKTLKWKTGILYKLTNYAYKLTSIFKQNFNRFEKDGGLYQNKINLNLKFLPSTNYAQPPVHTKASTLSPRHNCRMSYYRSFHHLGFRFSFYRSPFPRYPYRLTSTSYWQIIFHQIIL